MPSIRDVLDVHWKLEGKRKFGLALGLSSSETMHLHRVL